MDLNRVQLIGRLTRDPEVKTTPSGTTVTHLTIATGFVWTDQTGAKKEKTEFHNCVLWRKLGEIAGQYLHKGQRVFMEGRLETRDWTGQDGVKRYRTEIIADNMIMLDGGNRQQASQGSNTAPANPAPSNSNTSYSQPQEPADEEIKVEDIPF